MVVAVRKDGNLLPGEQVTFRASNGTLIGYTDDSTADNLVSRTTRTLVGNKLMVEDKLKSRIFKSRVTVVIRLRQRLVEQIQTTRER